MSLMGLHLLCQAFKSNCFAVPGQLSLPAYFQVRFVFKHSFPLLYNFLLTFVS